MEETYRNVEIELESQESKAFLNVESSSNVKTVTLFDKKIQTVVQVANKFGLFIVLVVIISLIATVAYLSEEKDPNSLVTSFSFFFPCLLLQ